MIAFSCPNCAHPLRVQDELAGKEVKCPGCGQAATVPTALPVPLAASLASATQELSSSPQGVAHADDADFELSGLLAPSQAHDELGRLGHYRILKILGHGGMGVVFEAEDIRLKRRVALKVIRPETAANERHRARFMREAQIAAAVEHDHICAIYEVGEENKVPYIAMPLLKGESLKARLESQSPLPLVDAVRIALEVAEGLAAAHDAGLVHRDIKPGNIWLESRLNRARVKILDFGLARPAAADIHLTQSGTIVGTPAYMAPEQARDQPVDHRADLFSLGVVLYEMTTGKRPFAGTDTMSILMSLGADEPTPAKLVNPAIPPPLSDLIMRLLKKSPDQRPVDARAVADELLSIQMAIAPSAPAESARTAIPRSAQVDATQIQPLNRGSSPSDASGLPLRTASRTRLILAAAALLLLVSACFAAYKHFFKARDGAVVADAESSSEVASKSSAEPPSDSARETDPADRRAVDYVFLMGGSVRVNDEAHDINDKAALPNHFPLTAVGLGFGELNYKVTDEGLANFKGCRHLTSLSLSYCPLVTDEGLANFKDCKKLTLLGLNKTLVTDNGLAYFKDCKNLTSLGLGGTQVTNKGLAHFKDCKKLTGMELYSTFITNEALAWFPNYQDLAVLDLNNNQGVDDEGLRHLKECKSLKELAVPYTSITDNGLIHLVDCRNLTALNLNGTTITDTGLLRLETFTWLRTLSLKNTQVTDAGVQKLQQALPLCKITWQAEDSK